MKGGGVLSPRLASSRGRGLEERGWGNLTPENEEGGGLGRGVRIRRQRHVTKPSFWRRLHTLRKTHGQYLYLLEKFDISEI